MTDTSAQAQSELSDEISLVDLAVTFLRRRRLFYLVFSVCALAGVVYALMAETTYRYTSLVQGAMIDSDQALESPPALLAAIEDRWLPEVRANYIADEGVFPLSVTVEAPKNSDLVKLISEASDDQVKTVEKIHSTLIQAVSEDQVRKLSQYRKRLTLQLKAVEDIVKSLQEDGVSGEALAEAVDRKLDLELTLSNLQPMEQLVVARQSHDATGPKRMLIVVLSIFLGGVLGLLTVLLAEFFAAVRSQMAGQG
ncbi:Wzz/FepE/Etk N-terminal domain-containing protein [Marinobacter bohaiensis]|uniref:Wzz/FepE/Etk N-terminal domain-containing protein n=1 Tax=Marinobacter bohaiensis TaxID=2201898 RepID=UPI000DAEBD44|nr:Wzz/FepE/Etk N-terminal domain-containing protein [Marinobacter bohaiensis]